MPELPEVETVRAALEPAIVERRLAQVRILDERLTRPRRPADVERKLRGQRVTAVERRGKYLIFRFEADLVLLIHLRMTGTVIHRQGNAARPDPHVRAVVKLDDGSDVVYRDIRRFGTWQVFGRAEAEAFLGARIGEEPLETRFTSRRLETRLSGRRAPVKAALLDQRTVAGLGNIYADEALWRARLHPLRPAASLERTEISRLYRGVRAALAAGIARQGATLRDYRLPDGARGSMQHEFKVYGRAGEPCPRCRTPVEKIRAAGRGTWYCPRCQPL